MIADAPRVPLTSPWCPLSPLYPTPARPQAQLAEVYDSANAALSAAAKPPADDDPKKNKNVKKGELGHCYWSGRHR